MVQGEDAPTTPVTNLRAARTEVRSTSPYRLRGQLLTLVAGRAAGAAISILVLAVASRGLEVEGLAQLTLFLALVSGLNGIVDAGSLLVAAQRVNVAPAESWAVFVAVTRWRLTAAFPAALLGASICLASFGVGGLGVAIATVGSLAATVVYTTAGAVLRAGERVGAEAANEAGSRLLLLWLLVGLAAVGELSATRVAALYLMVDLGSAIVLGRRCSRVPHDRSGALPALLRLSTVGPIAVGALSVYLLPRATIWVANMVGGDETGVAFSLALRVIEAGSLPAFALVSFVGIRLARERSSRSIAHRLMLLGGAMALPIAAVALVLPGTVLRVLFGLVPPSGASVLRVLGLAVVPLAMASVGAQSAIMATGRDFAMRAAAAGAVGLALTTGAVFVGGPAWAAAGFLVAVIALSVLSWRGA